MKRFLMAFVVLLFPLSLAAQTSQPDYCIHLTTDSGLKFSTASTMVGYNNVGISKIDIVGNGTYTYRLFHIVGYLGDPTNLPEVVRWPRGVRGDTVYTEILSIPVGHICTGIDSAYVAFGTATDVVVKAWVVTAPPD